MQAPGSVPVDDAPANSPGAKEGTPADSGAPAAQSPNDNAVAPGTKE